LTAASISVASTSVPRFTISPSASSCRFVSESSAAERPSFSFSIVWRKRQIEAWSGACASKDKPQKRRNDSRSRTASSRRVGVRVTLLDKQDLKHHKRRITGAPRVEAWISESQGLERRPVERLLDPVQKPTAPPGTPHDRVNERRLGKVTARHRRIIFFGPTSESKFADFCKALNLYEVSD
jgi:hypothetical protein